MSEETNNENTEAELTPEVIAEPTKVEEVAQEIEVVVEQPKIEEAPKAEPEVIAAPEPVADTKPGLGFVGNGAMGSTNVPKSSKKAAAAAAEAKAETVAVHSTKNVTWNGVGKVYRGYNIVSKSASIEWLKRDHVRLATPEEVAKEFGK